MFSLILFLILNNECFSVNNHTEFAFEDPTTHNYEATNGSSNTLDNSAACHFFFPAPDGFNDLKIPEDQEDPLAPNAESCVYQSESISIDDELLALETLQTSHLSSFSIIDPQNITEPTLCESKPKPYIQDEAEGEVLLFCSLSLFKTYVYLLDFFRASQNFIIQNYCSCYLFRTIYLYLMCKGKIFGTLCSNPAVPAKIFLNCPDSLCLFIII